MSCNYAEGLSPYENKGKLGLPETFDGKSEVEEKVDLLKKWITESKHIVFHTGAGVSTSAGIPDFRGPKGVWTLEKKGLKPDISISWDDAHPTKTHMAMARLVELGMAKFVISQNIDGLHLRSGIPRANLAELHGNMFVDECSVCKRMFVRPGASSTVGRKVSKVACKGPKNKKPCRGKMRDFVLDWEDELPDDDLDLSHAHSTLADLSIVIGSTLQIIPAGNLPTYTKKTSSGKLVIINLQPTKHDKKADLIIRTYADDVIQLLFEKLGLTIPNYDRGTDPVMCLKDNPSENLEYTQSNVLAKALQKMSSKVENELRLQRKMKKTQTATAAEQENSIKVEASDRNSNGKKTEKSEDEKISSGTPCSKEEVKSENMKDEVKEERESNGNCKTDNETNGSSAPKMQKFDSA